MGEHDVHDRVKTANAGSRTGERTRAVSEAGPFGGAATKVADADALKSLIEKTAALHEGEPDDRKTREVDPAQFRALLRQQAEAAPVAAAGPSELAPEPPMPAAFDDGVEAAFADPDTGADVENQTATPDVAAVEPASVQPPAVAVREPAPMRAIAAHPARGRSVRTLVIASVTLLALAVLVVVLAAPLV